MSTKPAPKATTKTQANSKPPSKAQPKPQQQAQKRPRADSQVEQTQPPTKKQKVEKPEDMTSLLIEFKKAFKEEKERLFLKLSERLKKEQVIFLQMQKKLEQDREYIDTQKREVKALLEITLGALSELKGPDTTVPHKKKIKKVEQSTATNSLLGSAESEPSEESEEEELPKVHKKSDSDEESENESNSEEKDFEKLNPEKKTKVFIRNLNLKTTNESLSEFIKEGTGCTPKQLWDCKNKQGEYYGSSFVDMKSWEDAAKVLQFLSGMNWKGCLLEAKYAEEQPRREIPEKSPREERPSFGKGTENNSSKSPRRLEFTAFIGCLAPSSTEESISKFFGRDVVRVNLLPNKDPISKQSGFVSFNSKQALDRAIRKNSSYLDGVRINVQYPKKK